MTQQAYAVGDVIRTGSPEPADGTPLLDSSGRVEEYSSADVSGRWAKYVQWAGPFVVAPDYDTLVNGG